MTGLVAQVSHWNSPSSLERPSLSQMSVEAVSMPRCFILYTCSVEVIGTPEFNHLDG